MNGRLFAVAGFLILADVGWAAEEVSPEKVDYFEKKVRPILVTHCSNCHSADTKPAGGLRVDDRNGLLVGGNNGPAIVPGSPEKSLLLKRSTQKEEKRRMPLEGKHLEPDQIAVLTQWIKDGAAWPSVRVPESLGKKRPEYEQLKKTHWAWQPLVNPPVPTVRDAQWPRDTVDQFLLSKLEEKGLKPVADADRSSLIRRLTFDLTGLPPTPEEIASFEADRSDKAVEKLVDRLLASSAFGEQWGRHWLDVARYGESTGPSRNIPYPHAWKYRDYVIDAVNSDIPFNRFIQEQVAGDLLVGANDKEQNRLKVATGFLALGVKDVNQRFKVRFIMDNVDEQIDTVTRSVLGLTVSCARCHDHKFDPIPTTDYYALAGIFTSTENASGLRNQMGGAGLAYYVPDQLVRLSGSVPPPPAETVEKLKAQVAEAKKAWDSIRGTPEGLKRAASGLPVQREFRDKYDKVQAELLSLTDPAQRGLAAHGVRDSKTIADTEVRVRGEAEKLGPVVPRGFLSTFKVPETKPVDVNQSGRLQLALWLTNDKNPLTARVYVNRVWSHIFGRGIVSTVDNFGVNGDVPSHTALLDHLATRFIRDGWSTKKLVRALVLSHAYQLGSWATDDHRRIDPSNSLVWRHAPRRLTSEEYRDAVLASSNQLDRKHAEGSPAKALRMVEMRDNGPEAKGIHDAAEKSHSRSIYLPLLRGVTPRSLEAFDPVEQTLVTGKRENTTVPSQALFVLNSGFIRTQALALAETLLKNVNMPENERVAKVYQIALGRSPSEQELARALNFLASYESDSREELLALAREPKTKKVTANQAKKPEETPADPDQIDQTGEALIEERIHAKDAKSEAWLALSQALFGSAEFRFLK